MTEKTKPPGLGILIEGLHRGMQKGFIKPEIASPPPAPPKPQPKNPNGGKEKK